MRLDLARWQFAFTSINHFFFIPITIGLAFLTALLQTAWHRNHQDEYLRLTRFFGTLLVINVAIGVVTGIVQEFEFGMNWGAYSRLVGNIFGAPLAMEGLAAFFLESTFLGLWLFGWDKLSRRVHLLMHLAGRVRQRAVGGVHHGRQLLDAAPRRLRDGQGQTRAERHLGGVHQPGLRLGIRQGPGRVAGHRRRRHAGGVRLAAAARRGSRRLHPVGPARAHRPGPGDPVHDADRRRARRDRGPLPADEDRGRGGAVDHLPAVLVLAVPDRRRQQRPDPDSDHRDPAPAVPAGDQLTGTARSSG